MREKYNGQIMINVICEMITEGELQRAQRVIQEFSHQIKNDQTLWGVLIKKMINKSGLYSDIIDVQINKLNSFEKQIISMIDGEYKVNSY